MKPWSETLKFSQPLRGIRLKDSAVEVLPDTRAASEEELRASYERGRADAETALNQRLLQQRSDLHELMGGVLESWRQAVPQILHDTENTMVALSLSIAQKLVADMPISVPMVEAVVRDALAQVEGTAEFTVRLHPADLELLQKAESPLLTGEGVKDFRFLTSPEVTRGGCLVQTHFGTVDACRETKFDLLQRSLQA